MPRQENTKKIVWIAIWIMHLLLQLKLFTTILHNILCFSTAFNIFVLGFTTGQLRSCSAEPRPVVPRHGRATAPTGCTLVAAGRALAVARLWLAAPWLRLAVPRPWLAAPWLHQGRGWPSPHNPLMKFIKIYWTTLILVICSSNKITIPSLTKFTYVTHTYETV
jgi:hypothetical protein